MLSEKFTMGRSGCVALGTRSTNRSEESADPHRASGRGVRTTSGSVPINRSNKQTRGGLSQGKPDPRGSAYVSQITVLYDSDDDFRQPLSRLPPT